MILERIALDITLKAIWEIDYSNSSSTLHVLVASSSTRVLRCQRWRISSPVRAFSCKCKHRRCSKGEGEEFVNLALPQEP